MSSCAVRAAAEAHSPTHHPSIHLVPFPPKPPLVLLTTRPHPMSPSPANNSGRPLSLSLSLLSSKTQGKALLSGQATPPPSAAGLVSMTAPIPGPAPGSPDMLDRFEEGDRAEPRLREHHHPGSKPPKEPRPSGVPSPCRPRGRAPPTGRVIILHSPDSHIHTRRRSNCASA